MADCIGLARTVCFADGIDIGLLDDIELNNDINLVYFAGLMLGAGLRFVICSRVALSLGLSWRLSSGLGYFGCQFLMRAISVCLVCVWLL